MKIIRHFFFCACMILLAGCPEIEPVPEIPEIEFVSFTLSEDTDDLGNLLVVGELIFSFQDGDGDIGLQEPDTVMPGDTTVYNLFFTMFKKIGGEYFEISEDDLGSPLNYRIPYIEPREGQNKILTGEINILFEYPNIQYDTIRYDFFITDRAMHKSNVESTPDIGLTEWKD